MKLHEIQSSIADYQDFIANCSESDFKEYFESADYCDMVRKSFTSFPEENLNVFLGIKDSKLMGYLVNVNVNYTDWNDQTQIFEAVFKPFSALGYQAFKDYYEKKVKPDSAFAIESAVGFNRIEAWSDGKSKWFSENVTERKLVKFFEIPVADYANGQGNTFNFGLLENNRIDIIVGNPSGLYDFGRPVPPFEPKF